MISVEMRSPTSGEGPRSYGPTLDEESFFELPGVSTKPGQLHPTCAFNRREAMPIAAAAIFRSVVGEDLAGRSPGNEREAATLDNETASALAVGRPQQLMRRRRERRAAHRRSPIQCNRP